MTKKILGKMLASKKLRNQKHRKKVYKGFLKVLKGELHHL